MVGNFPYCYYPQYANLNKSLVAASVSAKLGVLRAIMNRTITQTQWNNMLTLSEQYVTDLWNTTISEEHRKQVAAPDTQQGVTQPLIQQNQSYAAQYGVDQNTVTAMTEISLPLSSSNPTYQNSTLQQQITDLPNYGALNTIYSYNNQIMSSVTVTNGIWNVMSQADWNFLKEVRQCVHGHWRGFGNRGSWCKRKRLSRNRGRIGWQRG